MRVPVPTVNSDHVLAGDFLWEQEGDKKGNPTTAVPADEEKGTPPPPPPLRI